MKIEIHGNVDPAHGYIIFAGRNRVPVPPYSRRGVYPYEWDEEDIEKLLSPKQYTEFKDKFIFDVPAWKINILLNKQPARTREQLKFISQFI